LLHALLGVHRLDGLLAQPWVGMSWEGWVLFPTISWKYEERGWQDKWTDGIKVGEIAR